MRESEVTQQAELRIIRGAYAKHVLAAAGVSDARIEAAFADVPREAFLGKGPWQVLRWLDRYMTTPDDDPLYLYVDEVVAILPERLINNGQPSLHARLIAAAAIRAGDHLVHIGTGAGYYTAIMARLVGSSGRVTAIELDPELAVRARINLASFPNVTVVQGSGADEPFAVADVIYVNAGATRPAETWLERLAKGGRLILPLTSDRGFADNDPPLPIERRGAVFRIERQDAEYHARWLSPVAIFPCEGARDAVAEAALAQAFRRGGWEKVRRLYRSDAVPEEACWLRTQGFSLAYR
jgi:protein-L-isoaspartate(D-aspartate) O-methyltransferase